MKKFGERKKFKRIKSRVYWAVISMVALSCGGTALAQTNMMSAAKADEAGSSTNVTNLGNITVIGKLNQARDQIIPDLGATAHTFDKEQIQDLSQGANAPFNEIVLRAPGVAQDSAANGDLHVRGEHANLQYRINDVLLPEGITGFGLELDPRFVESMELITGSLPAAYGFRTAGVVDIHTKSGAFENGGTLDLYGGSYNTFRPSFDFGGSQGKWDYFVDGSFDQNSLGIENPTPSKSAIHDQTYQYKSFLYASRILSDTSRVTVMGSASYSTFQVPNTPGLQNDPANYSAPGGNTWNMRADSGLPATFDSSTVNENQLEQNYFGVVTYQKSAGDLNFQASVFGRNSDVHFMPDPVGDLFFNGVASDVNRQLYSGGLQADASYALGDKHTIRSGVLLLDEYVAADSTTTVFPVDGAGNPNGPPFSIPDNEVLHGLFAGAYIQDEWKILPEVTINYGARFDEYYSSFLKANQPSPRVNVIYQPTDWTTLHAGYARYFTPPPVENVPASSIAAFTAVPNSNTPQVTQDDPVQAERANYFDAGISQKITKHLQVGVDGYYKTAKHQLDDGLFGQSLVLSAFNYAKGRVYGIEATGSYNQGGFSAYANLAWSQAYGKDWESAQFLFSPADLAYVQNHWIYLDHDQRVTGSFGTSYTWQEGPHYSTQLYTDAIYGSGLRTSVNTPNDSSVPAYYSINLGAAQSFKLPKDRTLVARLDVVNLTDNIYQLRNGSGVGVNAAQYGERLGFFGSLSLTF